MTALNIEGFVIKDYPGVGVGGGGVCRRETSHIYSGISGSGVNDIHLLE